MWLIGLLSKFAVFICHGLACVSSNHTAAVGTSLEASKGAGEFQLTLAGPLPDSCRAQREDSAVQV